MSSTSASGGKDLHYVQYERIWSACQQSSESELAYRVNVNKGHISRIERGTVACSLELLIDLSNELHTSTDFLLTGIGPSNDFAKEEIDTAISILSSIKQLL